MPCERGHDSGRNTSGHCIECRRIFDKTPARMAKRRIARDKDRERSNKRRLERWHTHKDEEFARQRERYYKMHYGEFWEAKILINQLQETIYERLRIEENVRNHTCSTQGE